MRRSFISQLPYLGAERREEEDDGREISRLGS
jgi:hypothetical protein